jgi:hypothetical protein
MTMTDQGEDDILDLLFTNVAAPFIGDAGGALPSASAGSAQISLHEGALDDTDTATTTNETTYNSYARQTVVRSTSGWTVASGVVDNDAAVSFPECGAQSPETRTVDYFGITLRATGDYLHFWAALTSQRIISAGVTPEFAIGALDISAD